MEVYWIFIIAAIAIAVFSDRIDKRLPKRNFMLLGALIGAIAGAAIIVITRDVVKFALGLSVCPLIGMLIGMLIKKKF